VQVGIQTWIDSWSCAEPEHLSGPSSSAESIEPVGLGETSGYLLEPHQAPLAIKLALVNGTPKKW
jgi:hypothetical protein